MNTISGVSATNGAYHTYPMTSMGDSGQMAQSSPSTDTTTDTSSNTGDASGVQSDLLTASGGDPADSTDSGITGSAPYTNSSQANTDYKDMMADIMAGKLNQAQVDSLKLQTALMAGHSHGGHHAGKVVNVTI